MAFPTGKSDHGISILIFTQEAGGSWPILGAYYSGQEWIPLAWRTDGRVLKDHTGGLDITNEIQKGILLKKKEISPKPLQVEVGSELRQGTVQEGPESRV